LRLGLRRRFAADVRYMRTKVPEMSMRDFRGKFACRRAVIEEASLAFGGAQLCVKVGELGGEGLDVPHGGAESSGHRAEFGPEGDDALFGGHWSPFFSSSSPKARSSGPTGTNLRPLMVRHGSSPRSAAPYAQERLQPSSDAASGTDRVSRRRASASVISGTGCLVCRFEKIVRVPGEAEGVRQAG
jgi:hypothetical protein